MGTRCEPAFIEIWEWEDTYSVDVTWWCAPSYSILISPITYHVGACASAPVASFNFPPVGVFRHDQVEGYVTTFGLPNSKSTEWSSGYFPDPPNYNKVVIARNALIYWLGGGEIYVPGAAQHRSEVSCTLPQVSKGRYEAVNSKRKTLNWNEFHLIVKNCQHWANEVL